MGDKSRHGKLEENVTRDSGQMRDGARTEAGVEIELRQGKDRKKKLNPEGFNPRTWDCGNTTRQR